MKLKLLLILFLVLSIEGTLTRTKAKTGIPTWLMSPTDFENEDLVNINHDPVKKTHPIINIMLTTDDNFVSMNKKMKAVLVLHNFAFPDIEEIKNIMKTFTVVWTDHPQPKKRRLIPFESIRKMEYINAEDKMLITTDGSTYVTKLSPLINHNFLHRIVFRLICLKYETSWLYYQELFGNDNETGYILNLREYDIFPEEMALNLDYVKHIFGTKDEVEYLSQLNNLVHHLNDNGLYSKLRDDTELTSLLKILGLLSADKIEFLNQIFQKGNENLFLKIMGNFHTVNLPEKLYSSSLVNNSERKLMMRLITKSSFLEFKMLKHIISLWGHVSPNSTIKSLFNSIENGTLALDELKELRTLTKTEYFELYHNFKFWEIQAFLNLENLDIETEITKKTNKSPAHYKDYFKCFLSHYEDISALINAKNLF
jgi:hypothetical protein